MQILKTSKSSTKYGNLRCYFLIESQVLWSLKTQQLYKLRASWRLKLCDGRRYLCVLSCSRSWQRQNCFVPLSFLCFLGLYVRWLCNLYNIHAKTLTTNFLYKTVHQVVKTTQNLTSKMVNPACAL